MLIARSAQEAHLYMDLHACDCGAETFEREHRLEDQDGALVAVYEGVCQQCGRTRSFEFDEVSTETGLRLLNTPPAEHRVFRPQVAYEIAAFEEVAKFLPEGEDRIPENRFTSVLGRELYAKDPTRFTRERIDSALERKRAILADIDRFSPPQH